MLDSRLVRRHLEWRDIIKRAGALCMSETFAEILITRWIAFNT